MSTFCIYMLFCAQPLFAQRSAQNSARIDEIARQDARHFKLARGHRKHLWKNLNNPTSDYFKPVNQYTSDSTLLKDSFYVKYYRYYAGHRVRYRRNMKTVLIVVPATTIGLAALITILIVTGPQSLY